MCTPPSHLGVSEALFGIPQPTKISAENIIKPSFDDLSAEQRESYEALKKQRLEIGRAHV